MTGLQTSSIVAFMPYPTLDELRRLYPFGVPSALLEHLQPIADQWSEMLSEIDFTASEVTLRNAEGGFAKVTGINKRTGPSTLTIKGVDGKVFQETYDSILMCLHQAFESGYRKVS